MDALERDRGERGEGVELARLFRHQQQPAVLRLDRDDAARAHRRAQRQVQERASRERVGAHACRLRVVVRPLRGADVDVERRAAVVAHADALAIVGKHHGDLGAEMSGR